MNSIMKNVVDKSIQLENLQIYFKLFKLHKSYLALISDQKAMGIGDVTLGTPPKLKGSKSASSSYNLFGIRQQLLSSILIKRITKYLDAPVLLVLYIKSKIEENEITKPLINFINKNLQSLEE